uniref:beta-ketoacyl-[acyl-carrier-protein] synthase family protein n=1 Tax=Clostridium sp. 12(A) TaxID=1163671 RepID=UPI0004636E56|nr:beta-ketoacyl-[acyl-carrier-protein] synthase family protein [Clostridium sp. 12(A)]
MSNRVFITGMGMISPLGDDVEENWKNLIQRTNHFVPYQLFKGKGKKMEEFYVGRVSCSFEQEKYSKLAEDALVQAIKDSGINPEKNPGRCALIIGSSIGNSEYISQNTSDRYGKLNLDEVLPEVLAHKLADKYFVNSIVMVINSACSSASNAIGKAYRLIKNNRIDCAYVIGIDAVLSDIGLASFSALGVLSTDESMRPFDVHHNGFILSEGSGALILQREDHMKEEHLNTCTEIIGYGSSCDAYHIVAPDIKGEGAALSMKKALKDAGIKSVEVDYINCHGTGTKLNDESEYNAMELVFNHSVYASSTKGMTGHLLGACGIIETIFSCLSMKHSLIPGTVNLRDPIKNNYIRLVSENLQTKLNVVMNNTFAFGGQNASLILKKWEGESI